MTRRPPISTLFPYTTLSRSGGAVRVNRFRLFPPPPHPPAYGPGTHGDARDFERGAGDPGEWHVETEVFRIAAHDSVAPFERHDQQCRLPVDCKRPRETFQVQRAMKAGYGHCSVQEARQKSTKAIYRRRAIDQDAQQGPN